MATKKAATKKATTKKAAAKSAKNTRHFTIHMGTATNKETPIELFPDPKKVFKQWTTHLAERVLPVARFDLSLTGKNRKGMAVFLYTDDLGNDFLEWKTDGKQITSLGDVFDELGTFEDPPDVKKLKKEYGSYLALETFEIDVVTPADESDWPDAMREALESAGAARINDRIRIGEQFPFYVQSTIPVYEDSTIDAELPGSAVGLGMYFYLESYENCRDFQQQMQMT